VIDPSHGTNIALITSATMHNLNSEFGHKIYDNKEKNLYTQLIFETDFSPMQQQYIRSKIRRSYGYLHMNIYEYILFNNMKHLFSFLIMIQDESYKLSRRGKFYRKSKKILTH
jgi:hypothetical protein